MSINESEMETVATHLDPGADDCFERLRQRGCRSVVSAEAVGADVSVDVPLRHGDLVAFGRHRLEARATPGHTAGCVTYVCHEQGVAFTGDTLLIRGCGRSDLPGSDPETLYDSIFNQVPTAFETEFLSRWPSQNKTKPLLT